MLSHWDRTHRSDFVSPSRCILTPGWPAVALTLYGQMSGRVATTVPIFKAVVYLDWGLRVWIPMSPAHEVHALPLDHWVSWDRALWWSLCCLRWQGHLKKALPSSFCYASHALPSKYPLPYITWDLVPHLSWVCQGTYCLGMKEHLLWPTVFYEWMNHCCTLWVSNDTWCFISERTFVLCHWSVWSHCVLWICKPIQVYFCMKAHYVWT